ncbi:DUF3626 domain-containing protein [Angustibacter speluncae]
MTGSPADRAVAHVRALSTGGPADPSWTVTLAFHPDRVGPGGATVVEALARDGLYRSQFETGTSNGGLTAHEGGDRWRWESRIFGGAYDHGPAATRPVYGGLDVDRSPYGACPRFGSSFLRLAPDTLPRSTFCHPDSVFEPQRFGVHDRTGSVAGVAREHSPDPLDHYVEAHVHGGVRLDRDVQEVVLDPSFAGSAVEDAARRLGPPVRWTPGRVLAVAELVRHEAYRGPEPVALGVAVAADGRLDARVVGLAAAAGHDPQTVKRLWHLVARYGVPAAR